MSNFTPYVLVMFERKGSILLLKRAQNANFGAGCYCMVGGKIEVGETAREAAIREAFEEVGVMLKAENLEFVHIFHKKGTKPDSSLFATIFRVIDWIGELSNKEPEKHNAMGWFKLDELPSDLLPAHCQALACIGANNHYSECDW